MLFFLLSFYFFLKWGTTGAARTPSSEAGNTLPFALRALDGVPIAMEAEAPQKLPEEDDDLRRLLLPDPLDLPATPPSAVDTNFVRYFVTDFLKPEHDQYIYRHANGLCVVGLASTHVALRKEGGGVTAVDFNVGKSDRSEIKVSGKRKKNAQHLEANSALCKVCTGDGFYIARCCVKGSLLEVNDRLIKHPELLNTAADREGYIAIIMPKPADWLKVKDLFLSVGDYKKLRGLS